MSLTERFCVAALNKVLKLPKDVFVVLRGRIDTSRWSVAPKYTGSSEVYTGTSDLCLKSTTYGGWWCSRRLKSVYT